MSLVVVLVVAVLVAVLDVARAVAVGLVVVAVVLVAVLVLCVVLYRERNGSTIYVKNFPTVLFLVKEIAKLERERFVFCPRLFREGAGLPYDQAEARETRTLKCKHCFGKKTDVENKPLKRPLCNRRKKLNIVVSSLVLFLLVCLFLGQPCSWGC